jgi:UDP-glucose 4-epimerase
VKRIGFTGGRGRLAPLAARFFEAAGFSVRLFSRREEAGFLSIERLFQPSVWNDLDAIVHCAWSSVPLTAEQNPENGKEHDLPLIRALLQAAASSSAHFVFLSTAAIYGNTGENPVGEFCPPRPLGHYARTKLEAERILEASGVPATTLRVTNLLGERPDPARPQGILPRLIHAAKTGQEATVWGDGRATKDYLHCLDFLAALQGAIDKRLTGVFNVSSGESISLLDLVAIVREKTGQPVKLRHEPHFPWDVSFSRVGSEKLRAATGWQPRIRVRQAVEDTIVRFA